MKRKMVVNVVAHFTFVAEVDLDEEDESELSYDGEIAVVGATQLALASFKFKGASIEDPPAIDVDVYKHDEEPAPENETERAGES